MFSFLQQRSKRQPQGLKFKLPLSVLGVVFFVMSCVGIFVIRTTDSAILHSKEVRVQSASRTLGDSVSVQLQRANKDLLLTASLSYVMDGLRLAPGDAVSPQRIAVNTYFNRLKMICSYYESLLLFDDQGRILAGSSPLPRGDSSAVAAAPWFTMTLKNNTIVVSEPSIRSTSGDILLPISLKVIHDGKIGVLLGRLQLPKITRQTIKELSDVGINVYVVAGDGRIIACINSADSGHTILVDKLTTMRETSFGVFKADSVEDDVIGYYAIPQTNLFAVAVANKDFMGAHVRSIRMITLIAGILASALVAGVLWLLIFPVTRDIERLSRFASEITRGKQDCDFTAVNRKDELGSLAMSLNHMVNTFKEMVYKSDAATRAKSEFLARMSHEIRTPMNGILGMTYLAMREQPDPTQMHYLKRIDSAAKSLLGIINDILDFSKLEADKVVLAPTTFSLTVLLQSVKDIMLPIAQEKGLYFECAVDENVPDALEGDVLRIRQICVNLCGNALKFTSHGGVRVCVAKQAQVDDTITLKFAVHDTGIGIPEHLQGQIFDSFVQGDGSATRQFEGTGLGLAICRSLVELMGGRIWLESTPDIGSTFFFTLQLRVGQSCNLEASVEDTANIEHEIHLPIRILLVEDNEINQEIALEILQKMGATVLLACNGVEAIEKWNANDIDLILMDIQMPLMDGLEATRHIRASAKKHSKTVPIIAMTANAMQGDKEKSMEAGLDEHIAKPINVNQLRNMLLHWSKIILNSKEKTPT